MTRAQVSDVLRRPTSRPRKLIVANFYLRGLTGHFFNELLGYKTAGDVLGLATRILVPRGTDSSVVSLLSANPMLDPLPPTGNIKAEDIVTQLDAFVDATEALECLWAEIEACGVTSADILLFPCGHPIVISSVGLWLARRSSKRRPSVFFRFNGSELTDPETGQFNSAAVFFRLACSDLRSRPGQERVFLLADCLAAARLVSRACRRRAFLMPLPKYIDVAASENGVELAQPTIYVHLSGRSGRLVGELGGIIRRVMKVQPASRFIVKPGQLSRETYAVLASEISGLAEILPAVQNTADYFENFSRCNVVLLAYESQAYSILTSGVFVEATSLGKPVIVPGGTWMAQQIEGGCGAGTVFEEPTAASVAAALLEALAASDRLGAAAGAIAPRVRKENSCRRYIEQMMTLVWQMPDMEPRYQIGEEIDFSNSLESRCFMREGWGDTEPWGVWTIGRHAKLSFRPSSDAERGLILKALVHPFLTRTHSCIDIRVSAGGREIAQWTFRLNAPPAVEPRWCEALVPAAGYSDRNDALDISFSVDAPASPFAEGISTDKRTLGLGFHKLFLCPVT